MIAAILMLVFSAKSALKGQLALWLTALVALGRAAMLTWFIRKQLSAARPMVDMRLFTHHNLKRGDDGDDGPDYLVGFELLMAQELQFVHQKTPFEAGIFMLPVMVASGFSGPIAGLLVSRLGLREVATGGMLLSAFSFLGLALTDFSTQQWLAWGLMTLLGFSVASALLASSSAIMAAAPKEKAAAAGAIETMAYELGAGLGIALFGLILTRSYSASIALPSGLSGAMAQQAASSIGEAVSLSQALPAGVAQALMAAAKTALFRLIAWCWRRRVYCFCCWPPGSGAASPPWRNRSRRYSCSDRSIAARRWRGESLSFNAAALTVAAGTRHSGRPPPDRDATARVPPASTSLPRSAGRRGHSPACAPGRSLHVNRTNRTGYAECSE